MAIVISLFTAGVVTFVVMIVSLIFVHRLVEWLENHSCCDDSEAPRYGRLYGIWFWLGLVLFFGLYFGIKSLLESLLGK